MCPGVPVCSYVIAYAGLEGAQQEFLAAVRILLLFLQLLRLHVLLRVRPLSRLLLRVLDYDHYEYS